MREQDRVEPDVRVGLARLVADATTQVDARQCVDPLSARASDRLLDGRLEAVREVEHDIGLLNASHIPRGQLDVMRLGAGRGQVVDTEPRPA